MKTFLKNQLKINTEKRSATNEVVGRLLTEKEVDFIGCSGPAGGHQQGNNYMQDSGNYDQAAGGSHDQSGDGSYGAAKKGDAGQP